MLPPGAQQTLQRQPGSWPRLLDLIIGGSHCLLCTTQHIFAVLVGRPLQIPASLLSLPLQIVGLLLGLEGDDILRQQLARLILRRLADGVGLAFCGGDNSARLAIIFLASDSSTGNWLRISSIRSSARSRSIIHLSPERGTFFASSIISKSISSNSSTPLAMPLPFLSFHLPHALVHIVDDLSGDEVRRLAP